VFKNCAQVITVEPETVNFKLLRSNLRRNRVSNVEAIKSAVVGNDDSHRELFKGKTPYYYSFLVKRGRRPVRVKCVNVNDLLEKYKPTKLKVDIEGSEFETLMAVENFYRVSQIVFEYNFDMNGDLKPETYREKFDQLRDRLSANGFDTSSMDRDIKQNWNLVFLVTR